MLNLTRADWFFCLRWTLATAIALGLTPLLLRLELIRPIGLWTGPIWLGLAQGLALERYWTRSIPWGFATAIGGYLGIGAYYLLIQSSLYAGPEIPLVLTDISFYGLAPLSGGAVLGLAQAFVLRGVSRWWRWWPLVSGLVLLASIFWLVNLILWDAFQRIDPFLSRPLWYWICLTALSGIIGGVLKSLALALFLKRTPRLRKKS